MTTKRDYYETLEVKRDASQDEIKRSYRKLARKYHPDVSKLADAEDRFKEVGEAYECLKDPQKRSQYDQLGHSWSEPIASHGAWKRAGAHTGGINVEDILRQARRAYAYYEDGEDSHYRNFDDLSGGTDTIPAQDIEIPLDLMISGGTFRAQIRKTKTVERRGVSIQMASNALCTINIPPNSKMGAEVKAIMDDGQDTTVFLIPVASSRWDVRKRDIATSIIVDVFDVLVGRKVNVVDPWGNSLDVNVPAGTKNGAMLRLKGKGIEDVFEQKGDLFLNVKVTIPSLNEKQREILKEAVDKLRS